MSNNDYFRTDGDESTRVIPLDQQVTDQDALRAQEKAERDRRLGKVERRDTDVAAPVLHKPTTDKFMGSMGLWLLRWVTAGIMGVHGYQKLTDITGTEQFFTSLNLPSPHWLALGTGVAEVLAAVALFFGLLTRIAGLGIAAISILALITVKWKKNPFASGVPGFAGELELLLAAAGLALFFVGSGRWGIDGQIRSNRRKAKMAR